MDTIDNFYTLSSKLLMSTFHAGPVGLCEKINDLILPDQFRLISGEYDNISFPIHFKQSSGNKLLDMLDTGWPNLYLISHKMKIDLEEKSLTGWQTFDVNLFDKKGDQVFGYHGLSIIGRCGIIDYSKSEIIEKRIVPEGTLDKYYKGLHVDLDIWDGSDFFLPKDDFKIILSKKAATCLKYNKLTNIILENLGEIETLVRHVI